MVIFELFSIDAALVFLFFRLTRGDLEFDLICQYTLKFSDRQAMSA